MVIVTIFYFRMTWKQPEKHMMPFYRITHTAMDIGANMLITRKERGIKRNARR